MNRYPLWKYLIIGVALLLGAIYTVPNFFGESPAVQISSGKPTVKVDAALMSRIESILKDAKLETDGVFFDTAGLSSTVRARFRDTDVQLQAKDAIQRALNPNLEDPSYVVALNLISNTPTWLKSLHALPMYLGLDLRGGVHFLLQVDMRAAVDKRLDTFSSDIRTLLREKNIRHSGITKSPTEIEIKFRDLETRARAEDLIRAQVRELSLREEGSGQELSLYRHADTGGAEGDPGQRAEAEHHHAAQPGQRTGCRRARHPAAGRRPHRGPVAGRAGRGARQVAPRPHRDARDPHGRSGGDGRGQRRRPDGARTQGRRHSDPGSAQARSRRHRQPAQQRLCDDRRPDAATRGFGAARRGRWPCDASDHARQHRQADGDRALRKGQGRSHLGGAHPGRVRQPVPDHRQLHGAGNDRPRAADPFRLARRTDGDHRGTHGRPEPGQGKHRARLPLDACTASPPSPCS